MSTNQTRENGEPDSFEDRFIYVTELPSLQKIASDRVALAIHYSHYNGRSNYFSIISYYHYSVARESYEEKVDSLKIPQLIANQIKSSMKKVAQELSAWVTHFNNVLFGGSRSFYEPYQIDINWCVWLANGEIDYLKTGRKMLTSGELSEQQKFIILSEYCMEDEIKEITLDSLSRLRIHPDDSIQFYWICYLKNELHRIPLENYASVNVAMARYSSSYGVLASEYFWKRVGNEDRVKLISQWIILGRFCNRPECAFLERSISSISWHQQCSLLALKSVDILISLSVYSNSVQCALWVWKNYKYLLSNKLFARMIYEILERWEKDYGKKNSFCPSLIEIWETAHDRQRNYVSRTKLNSIIEMCLFNTNKPSANTLGFLKRLLALMHADARKKIIFGNITQIKSYFCDLDILNEIVNICLPYPDDKSKFMKSVIDSDGIKIHFFDCIRLKKIEKFNMLLPQDVEAARTFKKMFLKSITFKKSHRFYYVQDIDEWNEFEKFIDDSFADDESQSVKEKKRIAEAMFVSRLDLDQCCNCWITICHDFHKMFKIVEAVFADVDELNRIKGIFARFFSGSLQSQAYWESEEKFDETNFQQIIAWCKGNNETVILEFKKRESCDVIFNRVFHQINKLYNEPRYWHNFSELETLLNRLNMYLKWYLTGDDEVKIYKLSRLSEFLKELKIFKIVSERKDKQILGFLLKWFFNDDDAKIREFRSENFKF